MKLIQKLFFCYSILILVRCASTPQLQKPLAAPKSNSVELFRSPILDQTAHTLQYLNKDKDILYYQTYGGGGAGLGLLAGPFGVAANIKMIESSTMKDVGIMNNKIATDIKQLFINAVSSSGMDMFNGDGLVGYKLNPYLLVEKTEGGQLMFASVILMDVGERFPNKYLIQLPVKYTADQVASLTEVQQSELNSSILTGYQILLARIKKESSSDPLLEKKVAVKSEFLTPRFNFEMQGSLIEEQADMVWIRIVGGVCGVYKDDISYKLLSK